ncbi:MAG: hypothetical protein QNJ29_05205, partial [Rhizobiaceae bacterium]|nr:hypothetical protein [Rhizobiaceae bacterium]
VSVLEDESKSEPKKKIRNSAIKRKNLTKKTKQKPKTKLANARKKAKTIKLATLQAQKKSKTKQLVLRRKSIRSQAAFRAKIKSRLILQ